jgi:hypothetical protein
MVGSKHLDWTTPGFKEDGKRSRLAVRRDSGGGGTMFPASNGGYIGKKDFYAGCGTLQRVRPLPCTPLSRSTVPGDKSSRTKEENNTGRSEDGKVRSQDQTVVGFDFS